MRGHPIEQTVKAEMDGDLRDGVLAIIESTRDKYAYFAGRLREVNGNSLYSIGILQV